jgi:transcriptional regulator with XRE-family HTH domain
MQESAPPIAEVFGSVVRRRRIALGLSQEVVAHEANIHRTFLSEIERGVKNPTLATINALAHALHTVPSVLLQEVEQHRAQG